jgi:hypothetical protein
MQKLVRIISILSFFLSASAQGQQPDFAGYKIFINPGHGGYDSDDRHMITTDFWESEGNLVKGLFLRTILQNMNAAVYMSRTTNTTSDDLPLSSISAMANAANVDLFLSIHSNGFDGKQNQPLVLFRGYDNQPVYPESKVFALILWQKLFEKGNCWTNSSEWVKGDWTFYPDWGTQGLGVLRGLTMPGVLSEGSFHDYIPESWRLRNEDFLHHESWAMARAFTQYRNLSPVSHGLIAGVVRDPLKSPLWYFKPGTKDENLPLNGTKVTLMPGARVYYTDTLNNGFFMFDSVPPGSYKVYTEHLPDYLADSVEITVFTGKSSLADILLAFDTTKVPQLIDFSPSGTDSVLFNQEFTFSFDLPMDGDSVINAITCNPSAQLSFSWNTDKTEMKVKPSVTFLPKTNYLITLSASACSKWGVKIASPFQHSFVTRNRTKMNLERSFPLAGETGISIYPQFRFRFDAPLASSTVASGTKLFNDTGTEVAKAGEEIFENEGKGYYYFEPSSPLALNKDYHVLLDSALSDTGGMVLGKDSEISFKTRPSAFQTGASVETFDDISRFWDPEASGSTVGTDNPLTTFTASLSRKRSGTSAGRLDYVFVNSSGGLCRVFDTQKPVIGYDASKTFGIWVFGDLSGNILEYWFYSSGSANQIVHVDTIDWAGWELKTIPFSKIGGSGDRSFHSVVIKQAAGGDKKGIIWFDDAQLISPTAIEDTEFTGDETEFHVYPNPVRESLTVKVITEEAVSIKLEMISLSGVRIAVVVEEKINPGEYIFNWTVPGEIKDGIYLLRMESGRLAGQALKPAVRKCIIMRQD